MPSEIMYRDEENANNEINKKNESPNTFVQAQSVKWMQLKMATPLASRYKATIHIV